MASNEASSSTDAYRYDEVGMIKWFLTHAPLRGRAWPAASMGRACITAALVLSTLALTPPAVTRVSPTSYRLPHNNAGPYAATAIRLPGPRPNYSSTVPEHYQQLMLARFNKAIPAFARKYSLPCSACHTTWPELNSFGQKFRDNGYQLGNDRDAPIWQNPSYWPVAVRTTPQWHLEKTTHQPVDAVAPQRQAGRPVGDEGLALSGQNRAQRRPLLFDCAVSALLECAHFDLVMTVALAGYQLLRTVLIVSPYCLL